MLTPDSDARRMLVRERHVELSRDALRSDTPRASALQSRIDPRRLVRWPRSRPEPSLARDGT